jgi:hypothetical protein
MNAKEFRIGNYVNYLHLIYRENIPIGCMYDIISGIEDNSIRTDHSNGYIISDLLPIEIDHEWLLKFGFEQDGPHWYWFSTEDRFTDIGYSYSLEKNILEFNQLEVPIKYIHQLQNLYFSLTGQELTIK